METFSEWLLEEMGRQKMSQQSLAQKKIVAAENEIERLTRARDRAAQQHRQKQAMLF